MTNRPAHVGASTARLEDPDLLTGKGQFVDDIKLPGTLSAAFLRSPAAHAVIKNIDTSAAQNLKGVHAVYTLADLEPHLLSVRIPLSLSSREISGRETKPLRDNVTPFILVRDEVCYVGDPFAVVIADTRYQAEDALTAIDVDLDMLEPVSDCRDAVKAGSPPVHRNIPSNILSEYWMGYGDTDAAFSDAAHVFPL
ncbi:MAG: xanthine dehydrogenase family protein molybdopterin-binding subunit, partial [Methyloligellaceae bacterium]